MAEHRYPLRGEIDLASAPALFSQLMVPVNNTNDDLILDCHGLDFIDSSGIAVVIRVERLLEIQGRTLRVENLSAMPRRAFELLGLTELLRNAPA